MVVILSSSADPFFRLGNGLEAALWIAIGVAFAVYGWLKSPRKDTVAREGDDPSSDDSIQGADISIRSRCGFAFLVFLAFGLSDVVEIQTGAWWRPWWLFAWKAACVAAMLGLFVDHIRRKRLLRENR